MDKTHSASRFAIWQEEYINDMHKRKEHDKDFVIIQIEPCYADKFIVEVIHRDVYRG